MYITSAGARPKLTRSDSESYCTPNSRLRAGQARHAPIHAIQQRRDEYRDRRLGETSADAGDDRVETGKHRPGGEQVRQQVNAPVPRRPDWR